VAIAGGGLVRSCPAHSEKQWLDLYDMEAAQSSFRNAEAQLHVTERPKSPHSLVSTNEIVEDISRLQVVIAGEI